MHKLVAKGLPANAHPQLPAVHPVDLKALPRSVLLREKQLRFAAVTILPAPYSSLETAPLSCTELLPMLSQKLLPECLGTQTRLPIKTPFRLRPHSAKASSCVRHIRCGLGSSGPGAPPIYFDPVSRFTPAFAALRPIRPIFSYSFISLLCCCGLIMPAAGRSTTRSARSPKLTNGEI